MKTLDLSKVGETTTVIRIEAEPYFKKRLLDLGLIKGTDVEIVRVAPLGDPINIKFKDYQLSLRKKEARCIIVETTKKKRKT